MSGDGLSQRPAEEGVHHALQGGRPGLSRWDGWAVYELASALAVGEVPLVLENTYHPLKRFPDLLDVDFTNRSIYVYLREQYGLIPVQAQDRFVAGVADEEEAELLEVENGAPVMRYQRTAMDPEGEPIELTKSIYRADRFEFVVHFHRGQPQDEQNGPVRS